MTEIEQLLAESVAIQHVLWAHGQGFEPMEVLRSARVLWRRQRTPPTWHDVVEGLAKKWLRLFRSPAPAPALRLAA